MKICTVIGARPQFIKAATVSRVFSADPGINEIIIHTGQHYDKNMSDIFFVEMEIPRPKYNLNISGLSHGAMTGQMLQGIEEILLNEKPDWVLVYGDTNSTLAGALAAKKLHIKVAHVEAGLRSYNMAMPEEINRILTDDLSDLLFCPTQQAVTNLIKEGKDLAKIKDTGDVMYDATKFYTNRIGDSNLTDLKVEKDFILATIHRAENTDDINKLKSIIEGLNLLQREMEVIVPLHPRTRAIIQSHQLETHFHIIDPVGYFDMLRLLARTKLVITDSGGLQKEAFFFQKYCITLRDETEWVELIDNKFNTLVGADPQKIIHAFRAITFEQKDFKKLLYGDGSAAQKIVSYLY